MFAHFCGGLGCGDEHGAAHTPPSSSCFQHDGVGEGHRLSEIWPEVCRGGERVRHLSAILRDLQPQMIEWNVLGPQELLYQRAQAPQGPKDRFVSVASQFLTVASFSFSDVEESLSEAKDVVRTVAAPLGSSHVHCSVLLLLSARLGGTETPASPLFPSACN